MGYEKPTKKPSNSTHSLSLRPRKKAPRKKNAQSNSNLDEDKKTKKTDKEQKKEDKKTETLDKSNISTSIESNTSVTLRKCIGFVNFAFFFTENIVFMFVSSGIYKALNNDCYEKDGIKKKYVGTTYICSGLTYASQSPNFVKIVLIAVLIACFFHIMSYIFGAYGFWFSNLLNVKIHAWSLVVSSFVLLIALLTADILDANLNVYFSLSLGTLVAILIVFIVEVLVYMTSLVLLHSVFLFSQTSQL